MHCIRYKKNGSYLMSCTSKSILDNKRIGVLSPNIDDGFTGSYFECLNFLEKLTASNTEDMEIIKINNIKDVT